MNVVQLRREADMTWAYDVWHDVHCVERGVTPSSTERESVEWIAARYPDTPIRVCWDGLTITVEATHYMPQWYVNSPLTIAEIKVCPKTTWSPVDGSVHRTHVLIVKIAYDGGCTYDRSRTCHHLPITILGEEVSRTWGEVLTDRWGCPMTWGRIKAAEMTREEAEAAATEIAESIRRAALSMESAEKRRDRLKRAYATARHLEGQGLLATAPEGGWEAAISS